ncbi:hypothetical protein [Escherichia coli]|uniref:hypothetical protein n=1 Tax=Escherichia coli TaxID=562 RepID=UPI003A97D059
MCSLENKVGIIINIAIYLEEVDKERLIAAGFQVNFFPITSDLGGILLLNTDDIMIAAGLIEDGAFHYPCMLNQWLVVVLITFKLCATY